MQVLHTHSHLALSQASSRLSRARSARLVLRAASGGQQNGNSNERNNYNVRKGKQFENARRRKGRPAHLRSPYDSPLRDGNRDRLIGLLTERAAKTLMVYLMETNANVYSWLIEFYKKNPIPKNGSWDEVSGEAFLRKLLSMPIEEAKFNTGRDSLFDNVTACGVDPRSIAQRIMDIRTQLSEEFIQELQAIAEENNLLLRETLATSLSTSLDDPPASGSSKDGAPVRPELADTPPTTTPRSSSSSSKDGSSSSSNRASKGGSSSSSGAVSTPPPSPTPAAPKRTPEPVKGSASSSSASSKKDAADAAGKAAAVAALNAALSKPPVAGAGSTSSSSSDDKVDMADVLAQLRRAMEADVARDVMKMKEATTSSSSSASSSSNTQDSSPAAPASTPTPVAAEASAAVPEAAGTDSLSPTEPPAPAPAAEEPDTPAPIAAEAAAAAADGSTPEAAAAAQASLDEDSGSSSSSSVNTQLSSSAVGEAGTYSRMLPKGWGPRLGVGFSRYPRSRNNIVSSANLAALKPPGAAGDALSGSTAASEAV